MLVVISNKCVCLGWHNFYCEENCPKWFPKDVVFRRPNHPKGIIALAFVAQALLLRWWWVYKSTLYSWRETDAGRRDEKDSDSVFTSLPGPIQNVRWLKMKNLCLIPIQSRWCFRWWIKQLRRRWCWSSEWTSSRSGGARSRKGSCQSWERLTSTDWRYTCSYMIDKHNLKLP